MKKLFTLMLLIVSVFANAQVLCGTANENGVVTLTAPSGNVFTSVEFASYGTPNGACGSFTIGGCHSANSTTIVSAALIGMNSASINATNAVFGDPCSGTVKRLYIQATYSATVPLTLVSFTVKKMDKEKVRLDWVSDHEVNTSHFVIERSTDGILFEATGSVPAAGSGGSNYSFTNVISGVVPVFYYRLKMIDTDGKFQYSKVVLVNYNMGNEKLSLFPNPANTFITVASNKNQEVVIMNVTGQFIKKILFVNTSKTIDIGSWKSGVYFFKTEQGVYKFIKK